MQVFAVVLVYLEVQRGPSLLQGAPMRKPATKTAARHNWWPQSAAEAFRLAFLGVCGALAVVAITMIQRAPQVRAGTEQQHAAENRAYCEKWGMHPGTREHAACTLDLDDMRARHDKRFALGVEGLI